MNTVIVGLIGVIMLVVIAYVMSEVELKNKK